MTQGESDDVVPGRTLGRYVLRYEIAKGGMGTVYLAQQPGPSGFEKWVAIKWIHPHLAKDAKFITMFLDEARLAAQVQHANVCQVLDLVAEAGRCWLVMEHLYGESFAAVIGRAVRRSGNLPVPIASRVVVDAARGLHAAHVAVGKDGAPLHLVHRDVSPHNVQVLYDGTSKLLDFGVAKARGRVAATDPGELKGKIPYMAPEQLRRENVDRRADVWALGVVLWEALTGKFLFRAASEALTMRRILDAPIEPPSVFRSAGTISPELDRIVLSALERDLGKRTTSAADLADAIEKLAHPALPTEVAAWMNEAFAEERANRDRLLREPLSGEIVQAQLASDDELEDDPARSVASLVPAAPEPVLGRELGQAPAPEVVVDPRPDLRVIPRDTAPPPPPKTNVLPWMVLALLVTASAAYVIRSAPREHETRPFVPSPPIEMADAGATAPLATHEPRAIEQDEDAGRRAMRVREGRVQIVAQPAAEVFLGDRSLGITPLPHVTLPIGTHHLELRWSSARRTYAVRVRERETTVVHARLDEEPH